MYSILIPVIFSVLFFVSAMVFAIAGYKCKSDGFCAMTVIFLFAHFICVAVSITNAREKEKSVIEYEQKIEAYKNIIESLKKDGYKEPKEK